MEAYTVAGAPLSYSDLYSVIPFNTTFPDGDFSEALRNDSGEAERGTPVRSAGDMVIAISITALYSVICVVGLLGNILVMYGVVRYTKMKTATNIYIFNLALADALATSTLPFQSANYLMSTWAFGEILCKLIIAIDYYNMFTSIFTLTMMSVDRYIAVCHPVRALEFRTPVKAKMINVLIWVLSSAIGVPIMVMAVTKVDSRTMCMLKFPDPDWYWDTVTKICVFIFAFVVPVMTMVKIEKRNPFVIASWHLCIALGYTNSSLNPVLYAFLDENFKRCFRDFCLPCRTRGDGNSLNRARNATREPVSVCGPTEAGRKPA
uniref:G-protein coupled receptors family 1 profile domain-containing protein n=1 Tax=Periophthalmus magnuspinnatus TaxID=409849 RepID=A0A3B4ATP7_9GOBI